MVELSSEDGLALLDTALRGSAPLLVPMRLDVRSLSAAGESLPPLLQGLVRTTLRVSRAGASVLKQRLAGLSAFERERLLLDLVRSTAATVLSASLDSVEPERPLKELGLDSLMAVELCNRLSAASGLRLSVMLLFDYPTPRALARRLQGDLVVAAPHARTFDTSPSVDSTSLLSTTSRVATKTSSQFQTTAPATHRMQEEMIDVRGLAMCWCAWGPSNAPTVLIMHGLLDHGAAWDAVAQPLAARGYRVVAPDLRGHGRSAHISTAASYNFMDFVADLVAVGSRLASPFILVGHSMGALIASAYTAVHPAQVQSLILIEPLLSPLENERPIDQLRVHLDALSNWAPHTVFPNETVAAQMVRRANPSMMFDQAQAMAARLTEPCLGGVRWCWDARLHTCGGIGYSGTGCVVGGNYVEMLRSISSPLTLVYGNSSELLRPSDVEAFVRAINGARTEWLDGGHNLHHEAPEALAHIIDVYRWSQRETGAAGLNDPAVAEAAEYGAGCSTGDYPAVGRLQGVSVLEIAKEGRAAKDRSGPA
jgi:pimeloyl-ACP methyl ester carboxylesterase/acyl carrier protein